MSQTIYHEAIADARKLREMAEQSAKNKIIDAVSPRIRELIEMQLLGEDSHNDVSMDNEDVVVDLDTLSGENYEDEEMSTYEMTGDDSETAVKVSPDGGISVDVGDISIEVQAGEEDEDDLILGQEIAEALANIVKTRGKSTQLTENVDSLERRWSLLRRGYPVARQSGTISQKKKVAKIFESLAREAVTLRREVILTEHRQGLQALDKTRIDLIIKEMKKMAGRNNKDIFDYLFEDDSADKTSAKDMDEMSVFLEEDEEVFDDEIADEEEVSDEEEDVDVDATSAIEDLGLALGLDVVVGGEGEESDMPDEEVLDLGGEEEDPMEETYEIDESALRSALRKMRNRRLNENDPVDGSGDTSFGGGSAEDEMFIDVDEDDLLNALADELGDVSMPTAGASQPPGGDAMPESFRRRRRMQSRRRRTQGSRSRVSESRQTRDMKRNLAEHKLAVSALKGQLTEMNLFNAKLLYANKLMQNRNLTAKQQRAIVEALDNAKTLREAKLLYKSLTTSLDKGANKKSLSEGASRRLVGSSSRSTRSGSPANSGAEVDRWAVLAGLNKDN